MHLLIAFLCWETLPAYLKEFSFSESSSKSKRSQDLGLAACANVFPSVEVSKVREGLIPSVI